MPISHENISHADKQANPTFPFENSHVKTLSKDSHKTKLMRQYFKLLLSDILPVGTQEFQNQRNDISATEIVGSQSCEECLLSFTSDLKQKNLLDKNNILIHFSYLCIKFLSCICAQKQNYLWKVVNTPPCL